jgi:hypothetical protein
MPFDCVEPLCLFVGALSKNIYENGELILLTLRPAKGDAHINGPVTDF